MHQGHNIPWDLFASNFEFVRNDKRFTPIITSLRSKRKPNASRELRHFIRKFTQTIITFSETERKKYPLTFECPTNGNLFSDEIRDRYPDYLDKHNQRIEYWVARACRGPVNGQRSYGTQDARLADVVKVLLHENQLNTLLMLAHHPDIPIDHLHSLSWGHHFGFSRVKESAVRAYMFFNGAYVLEILENGSYKEMNEYNHLLREVAINMDFPAQQIPHIQFLTKCGVDITNVQAELKDVSVHGDIETMRDYLKTLFALMYRYDVLMRECGMEPRWEEELSSCAPLNILDRRRVSFRN